MMLNKKTPSVATLVVLALGGCGVLPVGPLDENETTVVGSDNVVTESRTVSGFSGVSLHGVARITIEQTGPSRGHADTTGVWGKRAIPRRRETESFDRTRPLVVPAADALAACGCYHLQRPRCFDLGAAGACLVFPPHQS